METLRSKSPICETCDRKMRAVESVTAPEGGTIFIYKCTSCNRLYWQEHRPPTQ